MNEAMNKEKALPILSPGVTAELAEWQHSTQWEALFEAMEDGVCVQSLDAHILMVNRAFAEMMGLSVQELIGKSCQDVFGCQHESNKAAHHCARQASLARVTPSTEEINGRMPGQRLRSRVSPVRDRNGNVTHFVMVVRDITDVTLREREQARLEQIARLGEMVAGLAHEIKNPLAGIQGAVDILIQRRGSG